ncbi:MAG: SAM-dependent methyltransferase [Bacteroidetes bacterium HGW-Bacteroidetes-17]|jgi:tRNA U34 5-methylaminomethyl-2-thiouridine-forming methyltransferase MnmC|nr:MAG: SAM-dependent methyltransferase [Bacteroidetes bacterium HGW-Bacteroidetes-17]
MIKLVVTGDGSSTLFLEELNEHYHSTFGAIQESRHIFIEAGFKYQQKSSKQIKILEIGFGTGLNALLSLDESLKHEVQTDYCGIEPYPVKPEFVAALNYGNILKSGVLSTHFIQIHDAAWNRKIKLAPNFIFAKMKDTIENVELPEHYFNLVYFDAFGPDVQSEIWTEKIFKKIYDSMEPGGVLVTYSVKGIVKRALKSSGFTLEKLPGPIGKREFLRASK